MIIRLYAMSCLVAFVVLLRRDPLGMEEGINNSYISNSYYDVFDRAGACLLAMIAYGVISLIWPVILAAGAVALMAHPIWKIVRIGVKK